MQPHVINMYCENCSPKKWMLLYKEKVYIVLDLEKDEYRFVAECPVCTHTITHTRKI